MFQLIQFCVATLMIISGIIGFLAGLDNKIAKPWVVKYLGPLKFLYNEKQVRILSLILGPIFIIIGGFIIFTIISQAL